MKYAAMGILLLAIAGSACGGDGSETDAERDDGSETDETPNWEKPTPPDDDDDDGDDDDGGDDDEEVAGERFDVQLEHAPSVPFPSDTRTGIVVVRKVLRLHPDGRFERCGEVGATNGVGGRTTAQSTPERGTYAFVDGNLILTSESGERRSMKFFYWAEREVANISNVLWEETKASVGPLVCNAFK